MKNFIEKYKFSKIVKNFILFFSIITISALVAQSQVAEGKTWQQFRSDFFMRVFDKDISVSAGIFGDELEDRNKINTEIASGTYNKRASLYDRFGGSIKFIPYYGEARYPITIIDKFYTNIKKGNKKFDISFNDLFSSEDSDENHIVYETRPDVTKEDDYQTKKWKDPRRDAYSELNIAGSDAYLGNTYLEVGNFLVQGMMYILSDKIPNFGKEIIEKIYTSNIWEYLKKAVENVILPIGIGGAAIYLAFGLKQIYQGRRSLKDMLLILLNFYITLGIILTILVSPKSFNNITNGAITSIDKVFSKGMSASSDSEVVKSDNDKFVMTAAVWEKSILEPWSKGMFDGRNYDEMYTQYDESGKTKLDQSQDNVAEKWDDGSSRFNSKESTGDITIPLGNTEVRNWAALAWSTQSQYHMPALESDRKEYANKQLTKLSAGEDANNKFPIAETAPNNNKIYVDDFRWIDALLNISYNYTKPGDYTENYINSRSYTHNFTSNGLAAFWRGILLLLIFPLGLKKLIQLFWLLFAGFTYLWRSIRSVFSPGDESLQPWSNLKTLFKMLYYYFFYSFVVYIMLVLYIILINKGILAQGMWIISAIIMNINARPPKGTKQLKNWFNKTKQSANINYQRLKNRIKMRKSKKAS